MSVADSRVLIGTEKVAKLVAEELLGSDMKLKDINPRELGIYIALNLSPAEIRLSGIERVGDLESQDNRPSQREVSLMMRASGYIWGTGVTSN